VRNIFTEIIPHTEEKLYYAQRLEDDRMDFPYHHHGDYELTLSHCGPCERVVGGSFQEFDGWDLVLIGPGVPHVFHKKAGYENSRADLAVIQFSRRLEDFKIFSTDVLAPVSVMMKNAVCGIRFSRQTIESLSDDIISLPEAEGIDGVLKFLKILYSLAISKNQQIISVSHSRSISGNGTSSRIDAILQFVRDNYRRKISLEEIGRLTSLSPAAVCRYFKKMTGKGFCDYVCSFRIDIAAEMMSGTDKTIAEICYSCGFGNLSNFNRVFKRITGMTPRDYRAMISRQKL